MKKQKKSKNKTLYIAASLVAATLVIFGILEYSHTINLIGVNSPISDTEHPSTNTITPTSQVEQQEIDEAKTDPSKIPSNTTPSVSTGTVKISNIEQANNEVIIQTELSGTGWKLCVLTITQGQLLMNFSTETVFQSSFSTCAGFSIPVSSFQNSGDWSAVIKADKKDGTHILSENVSFKVVK